MKKITAKTLMNRYNKIKNYLESINDIKIVMSSIENDYYVFIFSYNYELGIFKSRYISLLIRVTPKRLKEIEGYLR